MPSVLFVCTANICRSPMAMGLMRAKLEELGEDWRVESAGTWALDGQPPAENTLLVLEERGIDISTHRSRIVTRELLQSFNLILTMEKGHKEALQVEFQEIAGRIYLLSEMVGAFQDIRDPIAGRSVDFEATAQEIEKILSQGFDKIRQLAEDKKLS